MAERVGRNDPCPCGSGKKYKNCCLQKEQQRKSPLSLKGRKFTAKVLSAGGIHQPPKMQIQEQEQVIKPVDYTTLMERSFGNALHSHEDKPPVPTNPTEYLVENESDDSAKNNPS